MLEGEDICRVGLDDGERRQLVNILADQLGIRVIWPEHRKRAKHCVGRLTVVGIEAHRDDIGPRRELTEGRIGRQAPVVDEKLFVVKPDNALELLSQSDVDGALVGGAALKADSFIAIIEAGIQAQTLKG